MHIEAFTFIRDAAYEIFKPRQRALSVVEFGSLDVNGNLRGLFPNAEQWVGVDFMPGPGVDIVADAGTWTWPEYKFDLVICAEVLEHAPHWHRLIDNARSLLKDDGAFIVTAATEPREQHGAYDPDGTYGVLPGEHYENVDAGALMLLLRTAPFTWVDMTVDGRRGDVYACARP